MAAWTLQEAKEHLSIWLEAEKAVATGQSYQIGSRRLDRASLSEIRNQICFWKREVEKLQAQISRRGSRRTFRIIPRDF